VWWSTFTATVLCTSFTPGLPPATRLASRENSYFLRKYQISSSQSRQKAFLVVWYKASWGKTIANHEKREGGKEKGGRRKEGDGRRKEDGGRRKEEEKRKEEDGTGERKKGRGRGEARSGKEGGE
jgi:hypothetical protein